MNKFRHTVMLLNKFQLLTLSIIELAIVALYVGLAIHESSTEYLLCGICMALLFCWNVSDAYNFKG